MNKILLSILISSLMFFSACDEDTTTNLVDSYTIENMVGTWDMLSSTMDMTMDIDFNTAFLYMFNEDDCILIGGSYEDEDEDGYGCTLSDVMISALAPSTCEQLEGQLSNNVCTYSQIEEMCCGDSESQTLTIESDGSVTMVTIDGDGEETSIGTISIDGTDISWTMDDSQELIGTLSMSGDNAATLTFAINNALEELADDDPDQSFIDAIAAGSISITGTVFMIIEK